MTRQMSIKATRDNLAEIINQVSIGGDIVVVTKFGKPKALITPITDNTMKIHAELADSFGMWKDRKDMKDSGTWVADIRKNMSKRNE